jgi:hypothetical protein
MTGASFRVAIAWFCQFSVGSDAGLCVHAPEQAVVAAGHAGVGLSENELAFPAQCRTEVRMIGIEAIGFADHAAPPEAALRIARFTATRASWTL